MQFRWDPLRQGRREQQLLDARTQTWAGNGYGAGAAPWARKGVRFLEGDPDWPIVVGSVYNGDNKPPYQAARGKTPAGARAAAPKVASNFNELRFEDKEGLGRDHLHAENLPAYTKATRTEFVGGEPPQR